jgi:UDP-N-acetylglucosamine--N-acetylmuramyl-(pentapeptide) pyrophosphoryl-undecaprenol N-acetylglucosamine transferase
MKILIAGGGTAGHINPGIAVANDIMRKNPNAKILFVGTQKGLEKDIVPRAGFEIRFIKARGFKRKISMDFFLTIKDAISGFLEAKKIIREFKPDVILGTGGYVCLPVVLAGTRKKIPTMIHEANAFPGIANRILAKYVDIVAVNFKESEKYFGKCKKLIQTGNPIRKEILDLANNKIKIETDNVLPQVLVFGGSRGAKKINETFIEMIASKQGQLPYCLLFATGQIQYNKVMEGLKQKGINIDSLKNIEIVPYLFDMARAMAKSDLIISRSGAFTVSEITAVGLPSILIPFPYATENHQECNARALEQQGAAKVILEKELSVESLERTINELVQNEDELKKMSQNAKRLAILDAADKISQEMIKMA